MKNPLNRIRDYFSNSACMDRVVASVSDIVSRYCVYSISEVGIDDVIRVCERAARFHGHREPVARALDDAIGRDFQHLSPPYDHARKLAAAIANAAETNTPGKETEQENKTRRRLTGGACAIWDQMTVCDYMRDLEDWANISTPEEIRGQYRDEINRILQAALPGGIVSRRLESTMAKICKIYKKDFGKQTPQPE